MVQSQRDAEQSRAAILDAGETAFALNGYDGTSFTDICKVAGVSRGLPSYLFGSKDDLYRAVVDRAAAQLRASTLDPLRRLATTTTSLEAAIEIAVDTYMDYLFAHRSIVRLLQWEMLRVQRDARPVAPSEELFWEFRSILEKILKSTKNPSVEAADLLSSIVALCFFPFMDGLRSTGGSARNLDKAHLEKRKRHIVRMLLRGVLGEP